MKDQLLIQATVLPNAAATVTTNAIALPQRGVRPFTQGFRVKLSTSQATGANSKNITGVLQASNEANANFANIAELAPLVIAGNATNYPSASREVQLPPNLDKLYIRASLTGELNGGDASNGTATLEILH